MDNDYKEMQPGYEYWSEFATAENAPVMPGVPSDNIYAYLPKQADTFSIYQLKNDDSTRDLRFESFARLQAAGHTIAATNYKLVYSAPIIADADSLEKIFEKFNINRPEDFTGHSLSVSDIITLRKDNCETAYYVDSFSFQPVPDFLQPSYQKQQKTRSNPQGKCKAAPERER